MSDQSTATDKINPAKPFMLDGALPTGITDVDSLTQHLKRLQDAVADAVVEATMLRSRDAATASDGDGATAPLPPGNKTRRGARRSTAPERSNTMTETTQTTAATPNTITLADMLKIADDLGRQAGQGKDVQIKFDLKILEAAFHSSLDLDTNKHGKDVDDATKLSEAYARAQNTAVIFDAKAGNQRKLISNVRKCIKLGMWPKGGPGEPLSTVNELMSQRQKLRQDPANSKKLDDAHNTLMRYATVQLKRDVVVDPSEFRNFIFKAIPDARSAEDIIDGVRKTLNNLKVGKISNCPDLDNSQEVQDMIRLCTKRLVAIAKAKGVQPADAKSAAKAAPAHVTAGKPSTPSASPVPVPAANTQAP